MGKSVEKNTFAPIECVRATEILDNYIGQKRIKDIVNIHLQHYLKWSSPIPHIILFGNAGLGKTQFARILAVAANLPIRIYTGGGIASVKSAREIITGISQGEFLFIDETHAMSRKAEEEFYAPMQDFYYATPKGKVTVPQFTLIGATTSAGMLSKPFLDRFKLHLSMDPYEVAELSTIVKNRFPHLGKDICLEIARRSMGVPRIALRIASTVAKAPQSILGVFELMRIDRLGLQDSHRMILNYLRDMKRPVGVQSIAYATDVSQDDLVNIYERDLLKLGFIARTPRGREITPKGLDYLRGKKDEPRLEN